MLPHVSLAAEAEMEALSLPPESAPAAFASSFSLVGPPETASAMSQSEGFDFLSESSKAK